MSISSFRGWIDQDYMENRNVKGDTKWTKYQIVLDIPSDTTLIVFGTWLVGKGEVQIDGVSFEIVDHTIETTGTSIKREFGYPENLNFEGYIKKK